MTNAQNITVSRTQSQPVRQGAPENFTGNVQVEMLFTAAEPSRVSGGLVSFDAGARTTWHTHPLGQTLIVTSGSGRVQQWGGSVQEIRKGDTVRIPPQRETLARGFPGKPNDASGDYRAIGRQIGRLVGSG